MTGQCDLADGTSDSVDVQDLIYSFHLQSFIVGPLFEGPRRPGMLISIFSKRPIPPNRGFPPKVFETASTLCESINICLNFHVRPDMEIPAICLTGHLCYSISCQAFPTTTSVRTVNSEKRNSTLEYIQFGVRRISFHSIPHFATVPSIFALA